ncbi:MAG: PASTA domain-containing protein [Erysipelotrichaceae bacterium]
MSEKRDYLSELSKEVENKKKIESFQEEKVIRVDRPAFSINPKLLIGGVITVLIVAAASWFLLFKPSIEMPDFVGKTQDDISAWVRQQSIDTTGIIFMEEYNFDYEEDEIISQSIEAGEMVQKDVKITFVQSLGADPDEAIVFPDLNEMQQSEIKAWISDNKLSKTKISTEYSDDVEIDRVIEYTLTNVDEDDFTRGTTLTIKVSKGPQPAGEVTMIDFKEQTFSMIEDWAEEKKLTVEKIEQYHDEIAEGIFISSSVAANEKLKEGDSFKVYISKGKAITMVDLSTMSEERALDWCATNGIKCYVKKVYNDLQEGKLLSQSISEGTIVTGDNILDLSYSLGKIDLADFTGTTYDELVAWVNQLNTGDGGDAQMPTPVAKYEVNDAAYGTILSKLSGSVSKGTTITVTVSKGKKLYIDDSALQTALAGTESDARAFCDASALNCNIQYRSFDENNAEDKTALNGGAVGDVFSITVGCNALTGNIYINQTDQVVVTVVEKITPEVVATPSPSATSTTN